MRLRLAVVSMLVSALAGSAATEALAHGGQYRGPPGEVPPDSRQPEDPPPPETGGDTPTPPDPGGSTPTPPDPGGSTPTPPDSPGTPDPSGPGGGSPGTPPPGPDATRTGKSAAKSLTFESWIFWWNYNKDEILDLRRRLRSGPANSGDGLGLSGLAEGAGNAAEEQDLTARAMTDLVVPVLVAYARHPKIHPDIQASGVLGLARIGRAEQIPLLMEMAQNRAKRYDAIVEETAALSLG